jgi:hypothetical protein
MRIISDLSGLVNINNVLVYADPPFVGTFSEMFHLSTVNIFTQYLCVSYVYPATLDTSFSYRILVFKILLTKVATVPNLELSYLNCIGKKVFVHLEYFGGAVHPIYSMVHLFVI